MNTRREVRSIYKLTDVLLNYTYIFSTCLYTEYVLKTTILTSFEHSKYWFVLMAKE